MAAGEHVPASEMLALIEAAPPAFTDVEAARCARELFGEDGNATLLGGERDQTFVVDCGAHRRVLKISNALETVEALDLEAAAIAHLRRTTPDVPVVGLLPRLDNAGADELASLRAEVDTERGRHCVRLFEFVEGRSDLAGVDLSDRAVRAYGEVTARLGIGLRGFFHPAAGRKLLWNLREVGYVRPMLAGLAQGSAGATLSGVIDRFEQDCLPSWTRLRGQVMHGDLILENVRLDGDGSVRGIIDFGDVVYSSLLQDVASALASLLRGRRSDDVFRTARLYLDGYSDATPLEPLELQLLPLALSARLASIVVIGRWSMSRHPSKAAHFEECVRDSWELLRFLEDVGVTDVGDALGAPRAPRPTHVLQARRPELLGEALTDLFYSTPVHLTGGKGVWLFDVEGRRYLDGYNNVAIVGHSHPRVTRAVNDQIRTLNTHNRYLFDPLFDVAEQLVAGVADRHGLDTVMLVNSGSEANDVAWRLARVFTGAAGGIVSDCAYHGMTTAVSDLSPQQWPAGHLPTHIERFEVEALSDATASPVADNVQAAVDRLAQRGLSPAALFLECGFLSDGVIRPADADLARAVEVARAAGALVVADEVQMGHGRSGQGLWCFETFGITPDLLTLGKPMGNGYPVAAVITRREIPARLGRQTYWFSTFGGNPVASRAAATVLEVIEDEGLIVQAGDVGAGIRRGIEELMPRHPIIRAVRGQGLLAGAELADPSAEGRDGALLAAEVTDELRRLGVLVGRTGPRNDIVKIRPPLVFDREHAGILLDALDSALTRVE